MGLFKELFKDRDSKSEAIKAYNLGLAAKYRGEWEASLAHNQLAAEFNAEDQATWWNLGIAATALSNWSEARRAWAKCGIELSDADGEVLWDSCTACVRLNPQESGEVVWGLRIDPARIRILNVPLASSERRYGDILVHDGAQEGTRTSGGNEYPVFNELGVWRRSAHSTFEVELGISTVSVIESLQERCRQSDMWVEDWGTVRSLCTECSRGNPGEHTCTTEETGQCKFGFAAKSEHGLRRVLDQWVEVEDGVSVGPLRLVVSGVSC
jgi:hypothetical protein